MKLLIIGATGDTGSRLLRMAIQEDHEVTAFVRSADKLNEQLTAASLTAPAVIIGDVFDQDSISSACHGQDVVINAAGTVRDGEQFVELVRKVSLAVENGLGAGGRYWFFGGIGVLNVPGTNRMSLELPKIPSIYRAHQTNYSTVSSTSLNWSMLCPGPMTAAENGEPHQGLRISTEVWPLARPGLTKLLPPIATSLALKLRMPQLTVSFEDAAKVILDNLAQDSALSRKRVGIALPVGITRHKDPELNPS
ncbi:MAG TPA: hypothetical protein DCX09_05520 [Gammaproteobacteria bacterium]|nr:hypothetical protein [Gammaproteobacteria bacterium]HAU24121.1 hypothetical protein [Gammaproteobacteria bacterium]|tara:strand:+ start:198 stop:950 length:753 start_codon:yes stop_codon:yes gene_type:complete